VGKTALSGLGVAANLSPLVVLLPENLEAISDRTIAFQGLHAVIQTPSHGRTERGLSTASRRIALRVDAASRRIMFAALVVVCALPSLGTGCQVASTGQNANGVTLYQQGQIPAAYQQFQQAAVTDPLNSDSYYNMAVTLHRQGTVTRDQNLLTQAEALYNRCLDVHPNHVDCYRGLGVLLVETGRSDKAFNLMRNWAARNPQSADARIELARLYQEFGDKQTAETYLVQALQIDGNSSRALRVLGSLREESGDVNQALANYQRSYSLNSFQPDLAQRIAALRGSTPGLAALPPAVPGASYPAGSLPRY
jgi:tetratricopeptide (TPR) repeat protein